MFATSNYVRQIHSTGGIADVPGSDIAAKVGQRWTREKIAEARKQAIRFDGPSPYRERAVETSSAWVRVIDYAAAARGMADQPSALYGLDTNAWAREALDAGGIPDAVRATASRYAPSMAATMRERRTSMVRHLEHGGLDTSKLVRLAKPRNAAAFERDSAQAFRRRVSVEREVPLRVTLVADYAYEIRSKDGTYCARLSYMVNVLAEACEIASVPCTAYAVRGTLTNTTGISDFRGKPVSYLFPIKAPGARVKPPIFHICADGEKFIEGYCAIQKLAHQGSFGSINGTGGIDYAREIDGANFVIAIGNFHDKSQADIHLPANLTLPDMVNRIRSALATKGK